MACVDDNQFEIQEEENVEDIIKAGTPCKHLLKLAETNIAAAI